MHKWLKLYEKSSIIQEFLRKYIIKLLLSYLLAVFPVLCLWSQ